MPLSQQEYEEIKKELDTSEKPLILFDDDTDGICSFLQLYLHKNKGTGIIADRYIDKRYIERVREHEHDKIFVVDKPVITQEFLDAVKKPVIWIDHHQPLQLQNVKYFNPMTKEPKENPPVSHLTYFAVKSSLWIGTVGTLADSQITEIVKEFSQKYPDILPPEEANEKAFINPKMRQLILTFEFILLEKEQERYELLDLLKKIKSPHELLNSETDAAIKINKIYRKYFDQYQEILKTGRERIKEDSKFLLLKYENDYGFSSQLSNQLLYENPDKVVIVARTKDQNTVMSLRGKGKNKILPALTNAKEGLEMEGGGHMYACGAAVINEQFELFVENFKKQFN